VVGIEGKKTIEKKGEKDLGDTCAGQSSEKVWEKKSKKGDKGRLSRKDS